MTYSQSRPLLISNIFPTPFRPELGSFVKATANAMRDVGAQVTVLVPAAQTRMLADRILIRKRYNLSKPAHVLQPGYWSVSSQLLPWFHLGTRLTYHNYRNAVRRSFAKAAHNANWVYTHFFPSGWASIDLCEQHKLGCILGLGEDMPDMLDTIFGPETVIQTLRRFSGIIAVSKDNEQFCRDRLPGIGDRLLYLPNATDTSLFAPRDKIAIRQELGIPPDVTIAVFCGHFIERKGPLRVLQALKILGNVKGVFLGQGLQVPTGKEVLFAGPVERQQVAKWFAAADVFVLPSLAEGMSNAIVEAIASGLPVVVSDRSFNRSFLDDNSAVFVDPNDPRAIANGIQTIISDPKRQRSMSEAARELGEQFSIEERARKLLDFVQNMLSIYP